MADAGAIAGEMTEPDQAAPVPTDPTIYRFDEVLQLYGPTIKELIQRSSATAS